MTSSYDLSDVVEVGRTNLFRKLQDLWLLGNPPARVVATITPTGFTWSQPDSVLEFTLSSGGTAQLPFSGPSQERDRLSIAGLPIVPQGSYRYSYKAGEPSATTFTAFPRGFPTTLAKVGASYVETAAGSSTAGGLSITQGGGGPVHWDVFPDRDVYIGLVAGGGGGSGSVSKSAPLSPGDRPAFAAFATYAFPLWGPPP